MRTLIITGGSLDLDYLRDFLKQNKYDYIIGVDKGVEYLYNISVLPDLMIGDFDSINQEVIKELSNNTNIKLKRFIAEKNETDTHLAILEAVKMGSKHIDIFGGIGSRIDHTLANIHILLIPLKEGIKCRIINRNNVITLLNTNIKLKRDSYKYISLIPFTNNVSGITTSGLKYELNEYTMEQGLSIGISNELIGDEATISIRDGVLIIIKSRD
ncbi:MAG: thiamine diphosphokinase [Vallitalea sp.]|jgi:thiamine pyrophosphokinase|nr:thiamine diphosphokinase [Vallitalea sp.]